MKTTIYLRVARTSRGAKVAASTKPNHAPLQSGSSWKAKVLPTAAFAITLDIPNEAFYQAEQVLAKLEVPFEKITVAAEVADDLTEN